MKKIFNRFRWPDRCFERLFVFYWFMSLALGIVDWICNPDMVTAFMVGFDCSSLLWFFLEAFFSNKTDSILQEADPE